MRRLLVLLCLAAAAGCGGGDAASNVVDVRGDEYAYALPKTVEGGVVTMRFRNDGHELHEYALGRLVPNASVEDLRESIAKQDQTRFRALLDDVAGVPALSPGREISITRQLEPGTYALLCFLPAPDGAPHVARGMLSTFRVAGRSGASLPSADSVITARDAEFEIPRIEGGRRTIEFRNEASEPRGLYLIAPEPGKTLADVDRWGNGGFKGEAVATLLGAIQSIPPGASVYVTVELDAGRRYLVFDERIGEASFSAA